MDPVGKLCRTAHGATTARSCAPISGKITAQRAADGLLLPPLRQQHLNRAVTATRQLVGAQTVVAAWTDSGTVEAVSTTAFVAYAQNSSNA
jgi:hypothetical protein